MPRPRSLTQARIADAALAVLDRDGPAGLSMRAVAAELGVSAMALYRYTADRAQLEDWVVERVLGTVDLRLPDAMPWTERVVVLVDRLRDAVAAHPAAVPLLLSRRHGQRASLNWIETMLGVLADAGLDATARVIAQRSLVSYLLGALQTAHYAPLPGTGTAAMADLADSNEFPHVTEAARAARQISPDEEFHLGLAALLRGLAADLPTR